MKREPVKITVSEGVPIPVSPELRAFAQCMTRLLAAEREQVSDPAHQAPPSSSRTKKASK